MFFSKKIDENQLITAIRLKIDELEHKIKLQSTEIDLLRGQFSRKLSGKKQKEEEDNQTATERVLLPDNDKPF